MKMHLKHLGKNDDNSINTGFIDKITTNKDQTVLSKNFNDGTEYINREIKSLNELFIDTNQQKAREITFYESK